MGALLAAREVDPPDWLIAAGAIRDVVWDELHGRPPTAMPRNIDLGFFDPTDLSPTYERAVQARLRARLPDLRWDAKNQAGVHVWYPSVFGIKVAPFASCADAVSSFPEIATCVGIRLLGDDDLLVIAPYGLDDLFGGICRQVFAGPLAICNASGAESEALMRGAEAAELGPQRESSLLVTAQPLRCRPTRDGDTSSFRLADGGWVRLVTVGFPRLPNVGRLRRVRAARRRRTASSPPEGVRGSRRRGR